MVACLGLALALLIVLPACRSGAALAFQGARHYAAGSEALERGEGARAVVELSRAAELVPHASEIQNHLGLAYLSVGETRRARAAFATAVELDCDNEAARVNLERLDVASPNVPPESATRIERGSESNRAERSVQHGG